MWKGVTEFLENVDQRAAEIAKKHDDREVNDEDDPWDIGSDNENNDAERRLTFPVPPDAREATDQKNDVKALQRRLEELAAAHDAALTARDKRFESLQADYDAISAKCRALVLESDHSGKQLSDALAREKALIEKAETIGADATGMSQMLSNLQQQVSESDEHVHELTRSLEETQSQLSGALSRCKRLDEQLQSSRSELVEYRMRSTALIEEKDNAIRKLKEEAAPQIMPPGDVVKDDSPDQIVAANEEISSLRKKNSSLNESLQRLSGEFSHLEEQMREKQLLNAQLHEIIEGERAAREASERSLQGAIRSKSEAIEQLNKRSATGSDGDLRRETEQRMKELAESLLQKQSELEMKRSEVDQWRTRYEVSQQRLRETELVSSALNRPREKANRFTDIAAAEAQSENAEKSRVLASLATRGRFGANAARAAESVDRFSLQMGTFLRRHSLLRIFFVCYAVMLQLYVFVVISFSSTMQSGGAHEGIPIH